MKYRLITAMFLVSAITLQMAAGIAILPNG